MCVSMCVFLVFSGAQVEIKRSVGFHTVLKQHPHTLCVFKLQHVACGHTIIHPCKNTRHRAFPAKGLFYQLPKHTWSLRCYINCDIFILFYIIYFLGHFCLVPGSIKAMQLLCGYHANTNLHLFREIAHCFLGDKSPKRLVYKWSCFRCNSIRADALLPSFISQSVSYAWTK